MVYATKFSSRFGCAIHISLKMACNWCQDKNVARTLIIILCGEDRESWQAESNSDLCYCTPCVREYHKTKEEYIKENPECEKVLHTGLFLQGVRGATPL